MLQGGRRWLSRLVSDQSAAFPNGGFQSGRLVPCFWTVEYDADRDSRMCIYSGMECLTLLVYLYGRFLSRRAFGGDASKEARGVFAFLLLGDIFAEIAFINVELYSSKFWTLVFLDFFM